MSRPRLVAGCFVLAAWLGAGGFLACTSFSSDAGSDGDAGADGAGNEGAVAEGAAGDTAPGPTCAALDTTCDPLNCGKTGHSCAGGACSASRCQPVALATFVGTYIAGPVLDSARVLVVNAGATRARAEWCSKSTGCGAGPSGVDLPTYPTSPRSLVSDGTNAYVGTVGGQLAGVFRIGANGAVTAITPTNGTFQNADQLVMDGTDVLFVNSYQATGIGIFRVPRDGSAPATTIVPVQPGDRWGWLAVAPSRIFVADFESIWTCAGATCAGLTQYASPDVTAYDITQLVSDGTSLYWTTDQQKVLTCAVGDSCMAPSVIAGPTELRGSAAVAISIHGPSLFITTAAGDIFTCKAAMCGSTFELVATDEVVLGAAAVDADAVYWVGRARIDAGGGVQTFRLMRLAR